MRYIFALFISCFFACIQGVQAAPVKYLPVEVIQPDGTVLSLFSSGDEFYHWVHDEKGFTILKNDDGYCYYAQKDAEGNLVSSSIRVGSDIDLENKGIKPWMVISKKEYQKKRDWMETSMSDVEIDTRALLRSSSEALDTLHNIVIYISFPDAPQFKNSRSYYDKQLNDENSKSLKNYYLEASYQKFVIESSHFPEPESIESLSYEADQPRGYYQVYNATTNPIGYLNEEQRAGREQNLLSNAVLALKPSIEAHFTASQLDLNGDGLVENICFIIQGNSDGWSSLIWAHRWNLYMYDVRLHGKRVFDYIFEPENQMSVTTVCHEMFHALGAPDLYHYSGDNMEPAGPWDIMDNGSGHMSAYMKYQYGHFIDHIPEITKAGTYTLKPLLSGSANVCYKVASTNPNEFYVIEYRKKEGLYESALPGSGLLVYRINSTVREGNRNGPPDGVYVYRPNGTLTEKGFVNEAFYTSDAKRPSVGGTVSLLTTFLSDGSDGKLRIRNISSAGEEISFEITGMTISGNENITVNTDLEVRSEENQLIISNLKPGGILQIYTVTGLKVYSETINDSSVSLTLPKNTIYLVKTNKTSKKIVH